MDNSQDRINLTNQVIEIIFNALNLKHLDAKTVTDQTPIVGTGLSLDSIDILEIVVQLEHHFNFKLNEQDEYAKYFKNIGTIVDLIQIKRNA